MFKMEPFRPSKLHRQLHCPGSVILCADAEQTDSEWALNGRAMHELAAEMLTNPRKQRFGMEGTVYKEEDSGAEVTYNHDMCTYARNYADAVDSMVGTATLYVEQPVDIVQLDAEMLKGTVDAGALVKYRGGIELQVHDLKTGRVPVAAERNDQLLAYAWGLLQKLNDTYGIDLSATVTRVRLVIHQPPMGVVDEWVCSVDDVERHIMSIVHWYEDLKTLLTIEEAEGRCVAGEKQCRYCPHKAKCKTLDTYVRSSIIADFEDISEVPQELTKEVVEQALESAKADKHAEAGAFPAFKADILGKQLCTLDLIEDWVKCKRELAAQLLSSGEEVPGWKMVQGRKGSRAWTDESTVERLLKNRKFKKAEMYTEKLVSPAQLERVVGPKRFEAFEKLVTQTEGKPALAPASDKRQAIEFKPVADDFENVSQPNTEDISSLI